MLGVINMKENKISKTFAIRIATEIGNMIGRVTNRDISSGIYEIIEELLLENRLDKIEELCNNIFSDKRTVSEIIKDCEK